MSIDNCLRAFMQCLDHPHEALGLFLLPLGRHGLSAAFRLKCFLGDQPEVIHCRRVEFPSCGFKVMIQKFVLGIFPVAAKLNEVAQLVEIE